MDLGCYALHAQRVLGDFAGGEPTLIEAKGAERDGVTGVDAGPTRTSSSPPAPPVSRGAA